MDYKGLLSPVWGGKGKTGEADQATLRMLTGKMTLEDIANIRAVQRFYAEQAAKAAEARGVAAVPPPPPAKAAPGRAAAAAQKEPAKSGPTASDYLRNALMQMSPAQVARVSDARRAYAERAAAQKERNRVEEKERRVRQMYRDRMQMRNALRSPETNAAPEMETSANRGPTPEEMAPMPAYRRNLYNLRRSLAELRGDIKEYGKGLGAKVEPGKKQSANTALHPAFAGLLNPDPLKYIKKPGEFKFVPPETPRKTSPAWTPFLNALKSNALGIGSAAGVAGLLAALPGEKRKTWERLMTGFLTAAATAGVGAYGAHKGWFK